MAVTVGVLILAHARVRHRPQAGVSTGIGLRFWVCVSLAGGGLGLRVGSCWVGRVVAGGSPRMTVLRSADDM